MATITVEFDTKDKVLNVVMDGKAVENVSSVEFYHGYEGEEFHGAITTVEKMEDDDLVKVMRVSADEEVKVEAAVASSNLRKQLANKLFRYRAV